MYYSRLMETKLARLARYFPAVAVTGARQSGKTTLLRHLFSEFEYASLDLPSLAEQAERSPAQFLGSFAGPAIIDEVQYAPEIFRHLKAAVDKRRHQPGQFLLTGSQHFSLMKGVSESLAGRIGFLELENLSLAEIRTERSLEPTRRELLGLMVRGQFPELWRVPEFPGLDFYAGYVAAYLERDVRQLLNVTSLRDFERFLRILASRSANVLNKSDVARGVGVSVKAIGDWVSVLQASGQISLLEPWFTNISKRVVKTPKVYFRDTGLLCFLLNLTEETLPSSPLLGAVWETFIYAELRKRIAASQHPIDLWFYRDQRAREIDFVIETGGRLSFLEVKWQETPRLEEARSIQAVSRELAESSSPWKPGRHFVLGTPEHAYPISEGITAINVDGLEQVLR